MGCEKEKPGINAVTALLLAYMSSWQKDGVYASFLKYRPTKEINWSNKLYSVGKQEQFSWCLLMSFDIKKNFLKHGSLLKIEIFNNISFVLESEPESKDSSTQILWAVLRSVRRN